jgi:hypothetical protein
MIMGMTQSVTATFAVDKRSPGRSTLILYLAHAAPGTGGARTPRMTSGALPCSGSGRTARRAGPRQWPVRTGWAPSFSRTKPVRPPPPAASLGGQVARHRIHPGARRVLNRASSSNCRFCQAGRLLRAWRRERVAWAGAAGTREATWRGRRVRRPRTRRAGRRRGCPAGGQIGRRRLTNETGWTGRTLRRDGSGPDRMAGPSQHAGHGGGAHDGRGAHGEPAPPAEAPAPSTANAPAPVPSASPSAVGRG